MRSRVELSSRSAGTVIGRGCRCTRWPAGTGCQADGAPGARIGAAAGAQAPAGPVGPKLGPYRALIDSWLVADREAPRKQRHTARRVWERLRDEQRVEVSERQVRRYVRERQRGWASSSTSCSCRSATSRRRRRRSIGARPRW